MASLRERLEAVAAGRSDALPVMSREEARAAAAKVLALLAAAKRALFLVEENNEEVIKMSGSFGLYADLTTALAAFEEEQPRA